MADHHPKKMKKASRGRQKIEMKKIEQSSNRQVAFSKRRSGLFKKAGELAILCGAEVAIMVLSEREKPFSFGHPSADIVINRFLSGSSSSSHSDINWRTCPNNYSSSTYPLIDELNKQYEEAVKELEKEKKKKGEKMDENGSLFLWDFPIENMSLEEVEEYRESLLEMRHNVVARVEQLMMI